MKLKQMSGTVGTAAQHDVGTAANNVVQLVSGGKLPEVDGSQLNPAPTVSGASESSSNIPKYNLIDANFIKIIICAVLLIPALLIYVFNQQVDWQPAIALATGQGIGAWLATSFALENKKANLWVRYLLLIMVSLAIIKLFELYKYLV